MCIHQNWLLLGLENAVELLIKSRANVNVEGKNGNTPLILAAEKGNSNSFD